MRVAGSFLVDFSLRETHRVYSWVYYNDNEKAKGSLVNKLLQSDERQAAHLLNILSY